MPSPLNTRKPTRLAAWAAMIAVAALAGCSSPRSGGTPPSGGPGGTPPSGGPDGGASMGGGIQAIALLFTDYDTDRDRRVTTAELEQGATESFAGADGDSNGMVTPLEYAAWSKAALGSETALPGRLAFDPDFNNSITPDEFRNALRQQFIKLDKDSDGVLTRAELLAPAPQAGIAPGGGRPSGGPPSFGGRRPR